MRHEEILRARAVAEGLEYSVSEEDCEEEGEEKEEGENDSVNLIKKESM